MKHALSLYHFLLTCLIEILFLICLLSSIIHLKNKHLLIEISFDIIDMCKLCMYGVYVYV